MNYYQARQIDPESARPESGRWHYTCRNDDRIWPVGACADGCAGHDTAEEACQHYVEGEVAAGVKWLDCSWTTCSNRSANKPSCDKPARKIAEVGNKDHLGYTLCDDHAADNVAIALYRLDHQGEFSSFGSW